MSGPPPLPAPIEAAAPPSDPFDDAPAAAPDFSCPQCGGGMRFNPSHQNLRCGYCGHERAIAPPSDPLEDRVEAVDYASADAARAEGPLAEQPGRARPPNAGAWPPPTGRKPTARWRTETTISCGACGAETTLTAGRHASVCPFCASPLIGDPGANRVLRPMGALPFVISETEAQAALQSWLEGLWFAPSALRRDAQEDGAFSGVYLPFWTFDADGEANYHGRRGDHYYTWTTITVGGRRQRRRVRRTRWRSVSGHVSQRFQNVPILGSQTLPDGASRRLLSHGFDFHGLQPYRDDYLAGFRAEIYTVPVDDAYRAACDAMTARLRVAARHDIGGDEQRVLRLSPRFFNPRFKLIVAPVWIAAYRFGSDRYRIIVNGRTGRVSGERPYSRWKLALAGLGAALAVAAVAFVILTVD